MARSNPNKVDSAQRHERQTLELRTTQAERERQLAALRFAYDEVDPELRDTMQSASLDILHRLRRTLDDMIIIGQKLNQIKELLDEAAHPPGTYRRWVQTEFGLSVGSASEFRSIATRFADKVSIIERLTPTTARLLSASNVPDDAIDAVVSASEDEGRRLKVKEVKQIIQPYMPPREAPEPIYVEIDDDGPTDEEIADKVAAFLQRADEEPGEVHIRLSRALAMKLRDAVLHRTLKTFFTPDESDELLLALSKALK